MLTVDTKRLGVRPGDVVLDLGCGAGRHTYHLQRLGAFAVAVDLDDVALKDTAAMMQVLASEEAAAQGAATVADALSLPFRDGSFDRIIVSEVLEHIPDDGSALAELFRILRPGGGLAITVPRSWPEAVCWALSREYHDTPGGHVRIYRRSQLVDRARAAGFEPVSSHHAHAFHSAYWWLRCATGLDGRSLPARWYHSALVWDIEHPNRLVRTTERALDPFFGKSFALYLVKPRVG